jgi:hypothetical protein
MSQSAELSPAVHEHADVGRQLARGCLRIVRMGLCSMEMHAAGDIAGLDDIAGHLGAVDLASYFTRAGIGAF